MHQGAPLCGATQHSGLRWGFETTSKDYLQVADKYLVGSWRSWAKNKERI
jgi:hypothetical protein